MRLMIKEKKKEWIEKAAVTKTFNDYSKEDMVALTEEETSDYYIFWGRVYQFNLELFKEKVFLVDGKWIDLTMYYSSEDLINNFVGLLDDWQPFDDMKKHRVAKPTIGNHYSTEQATYKRKEQDYHMWWSVKRKEIQKLFKSKSCIKQLLFSKNMGGKKRRSFYSMEAGDGIALVVHDNWNGSVRSLAYNYSKKDVTPKEGCYPDVSGFASPGGRYFFAVYCNQRNGRLSWPYEYDIYRIDTRTLNGRYITACATCYKDKKGFTVVTGKEDPVAIHGANLDRYETYDFTGHRVSKGKYIPEEEMYKDFENRKNTNLPFFE